MSQATIETRGPVMENLCEIIIEDREDRETLFLDNADVDRARAQGHVSLLALVGENVGQSGRDILQAAYANGTTVTLDGEVVAPQDMVDGLGITPTPKPV